ncbi:hypothetical protein BK010_06255 [Tenericutes bacterium MO-XQ]|nr:hypothetical protein BK010_06255 [Tenericutes bacterium MO-XQ]
MNKRISRLRLLNLFIYTFFIASFIFIQILFFSDIAVNNNVIGVIMFLNAYAITFYIINNIYFSSFIDNKVNKPAKINMLYKYILFLLMNILFANRIEFSLFYIIIVLLISLLSVFDNISLNKFLTMLISRDVMDSKDVSIENRDNRIKKWENSENFKSFQYNLAYFIFSIFGVYATSYFTDFSTVLDLSVFVLLFTVTLLLGIMYCQGLSKHIKIKWYEYVLFEGFYGLVLLLLYFNMNFLIGLAIIPLVPILRKENKIRKKILSNEDDKIK